MTLTEFSLTARPSVNLDPGGSLADLYTFRHHKLPQWQRRAAQLAEWLPQIKRVEQARMVAAPNGWRFASTAQIEWYDRWLKESAGGVRPSKTTKPPFTVTYQEVAYGHDDQPLAVLTGWPEYDWKAELVEAQAAARRQEGINGDDIDAAWHAHCAAEDCKKQVARERNRIRNQNHVIHCFRTVPYWQAAPDLSDRIAREQAVIEDAKKTITRLEDELVRHTATVARLAPTLSSRLAATEANRRRLVPLYEQAVSKIPTCQHGGPDKGRLREVQIAFQKAADDCQYDYDRTYWERVLTRLAAGEQVDLVLAAT